MTTMMRTFQPSMSIHAVAPDLGNAGLRVPLATTLCFISRKRCGAHLVEGLRQKVFCCDVRAQTQHMHDVPGVLEKSRPFLGCEKLPRWLHHQPAVVSLLYYTRPDTRSCWYLSFQVSRVSSLFFSLPHISYIGIRDARARADLKENFGFCPQRFSDTDHTSCQIGEVSRSFPFCISNPGSSGDLSRSEI